MGHHGLTLLYLVSLLFSVLLSRSTDTDTARGYHGKWPYSCILLYLFSSLHFSFSVLLRKRTHQLRRLPRVLLHDALHLPRLVRVVGLVVRRERRLGHLQLDEGTPALGLVH